jgi:hypothetical protein
MDSTDAGMQTDFTSRDLENAPTTMPVTPGGSFGFAPEETNAQFG